MVRLLRREVLTGLAAAGALVPIGISAARAEALSTWAQGDHARVRLIDAGPSGPNRLVGLQIQLDPGYLTYWRTPGEAGLPPTPDFSKSDNLASATLHFPAPGRFDEGGAEAFGYKDDVVFPITITPKDAGRPVMLDLSLSFAVCGTLCLPASATLRLDLTGSGSGPEPDLVRAAERLVPVATELGAAGPLAILAVESGPSPGLARVLARAADDSTPALFVEAADPWYIHADAGRKLADGTVAFDLQILAGATQPTPVDVVLTLTANGGAVQTRVRLPAAAKP